MIELLNRALAPLQRVVALAAHRSDLALAVLLTAVVFMLIVPMPTFLIDILVALNIGLSALLLMVAMYLPNPVAFSSFPSVLLITTLFRLALTIATTRLILLQADAGHIIEAFGEFVVGGNLVVGLVVFLILTVVQFIVVTKGAERVAEVAARFSLDALPGKQMSIDGDMRAGAIDLNEARRRRGLLEKESQLYGAMDGAMKFVKGDAIAGIVIVAVNLLGGLAVGTLQQGMAAADAVRLYSVLTIGDGLVAQIPALFIAITAGIIITRVTSVDGSSDSNLGRDITHQIIARPQALLIAAGILFLFALVPGMPAAVFVPMALLAVVLGWVLRSGPVDGKTGSPRPKAAASGIGGTARDTAPAGGSAREEDPQGEIFFPTIPLLMEMSDALRDAFDPRVLDQKLLTIRKGLYYDLGVPFPGIHLRFNPMLPERSYRLLVHEVPVTEGKLRPGWLLAQDTEEHLAALGIAFEVDEPFLPRWPTVWVQEAHAGRMHEMGIPAMDQAQILVYHTASVLKRHPAEFLGIQETRYLIGKMEQELPDLMKELQRVVAPQRIAEVLSRLVSEGVSIRNMRAIAEALIDWAQKEKDAVLLTEHVRTALRRQISHKFSAGRNVLPAHLLGPAAEETLRNAVRQTSAGSYLALDPSLSRRLVENVVRAVGDLTRVSQVPVLLTGIDVRRYLRKLIEQELFEVPVLSYQELSNDVNVHPLSRIEIA